MTYLGSTEADLLGITRNTAFNARTTHRYYTITSEDFDPEIHKGPIPTGPYVRCLQQEYIRHIQHLSNKDIRPINGITEADLQALLHQAEQGDWRKEEDVTDIIRATHTLVGDLFDERDRE